MTAIFRSRVKRIPLVVAIASVISFTLLVFIARHELDAAVMSENRHQVESASNVLGMLLSGVHGEMIPANLNPRVIPESTLEQTAIVDRVKLLTGAEATIFLERDGSFVRSATTIRLNGRRAVGTNLAGPALEGIRASGHFSGISPILGHAYLADYN